MLRTRIPGAALLAVAALLAPSAPAWADAHSPGSSGVGDPYFPHAGNGGYDVQHYDLKLRYTPKSGEIDSTATITAKATKGLSRFNLDLSGLTVRSVTVDGRRAKWSRKGQELTVTPKKGIADEATFKVVVDYDGRPKPAGDSELGVTGFIHTKDGAVVVSQPDGARTWFPANDTPRDKATFSYEISAPAGLAVLANGEPQNSGIVRVKKGYVVSRWKMAQPMAPYLAMIAIGKYKVTESTTGGLLNITAYDPALAKTAKYLHKETAEATKWGAEHFGPYPFGSTGGIADKLGVNFALETQGRPVYDGDASDDLLIVHEIAHQWFGDSVGVKSWNDIWLNEGLASYAEWLYEETHNGPTAAKTFATYYKNTGKFWDVKTGDPGQKNMFDWEAIYLRGAMTVHALRVEIGDETFFELLKEWPARYKHATATTKDFIALAEELSGEDLGPLFKKWLYVAKKPAL